VKEFVFTADIRFYAEDLQEAFEQLRDHFHALAEDDDRRVLDMVGEMELRRKEEVKHETGRGGR
jgi:hypothetical protein